MYSSFGRTTATIATLVLAFALSACGGGRSGGFASLTPENQALLNRPIDPAAPSSDTMKLLMDAFTAELAKLGKSASATGRLAPTTGNAVNDLAPNLLDADGDGALPPYGVSLRWSERLLGDYDQNGEVGLSDLTKLGQYLNYTVVYDPAEIHGGVADIPSGDPNDRGDIGPGLPITPNSGAFNWRLARIDGNRDGIIDIRDITPIAQHYREAVTGYIVYRKGPQDTDFVQLENQGSGGQDVTIRRFDLLEQVEDALEPLLPVQYAVPDFFILDAPQLGAEYAYKVLPFCSDVPASGPESALSTIQPFNSQANNDGVVPVLTASPIGGSSAQAVGLTGTAPFGVHFDGSGSHVPAGTIANYLWDFDGDREFELSTGATATQDHTYTQNARLMAGMRLLAIEDPAYKAGSSLIHQVSDVSVGAVTEMPIVIKSAAGNNPPTAVLTADKSLGTVPLTVRFNAQATDTDGTLKFFEWDWNEDGVTDFTSTTPTATYTFGVAGMVTVRVKVIDNNGGYTLGFLPVISSAPDGNWPPTASMVVNPTSGAAPLNVTFNARKSMDPDGQIVKYEWDLNGDFAFDVDSGAEPVLDYTFPVSGIYNVWLRATDAGGLFDLARTTIRVNTPPFGGLEGSPLVGTGPLTVNFEASASLDLDGTIVKYEWDFNNDGTYDQDTGTVPRVSHTFYSIGSQTTTLRITDDLGLSSTVSLTVEVTAPSSNLTPVVTLTASPAVLVGSVPRTTRLIVTASDPDPDGSIDHYDWDFDGDGLIDFAGTEVEVPHPYYEHGLYHVWVYAVDNAGSAAGASYDLKVWDGTNEPPTATITVDKNSAPANDPITFTANASDPGGGALTYAWDFNGDGSPEATTAVATRAFSALGSYTAVLRVTDGGGAVTIANKKVIVGDAPVAKLVADRSYAEVPDGKFLLDASRSTGENGSITNFEWDLNGDGTFELSTGVSPFAEVIFGLDDLSLFPGGAIHPQLRVTNEAGAVTETTGNAVLMPATDALGQPLRDNDGNLVRDEDGGVKLEPAKPLKAGGLTGTIYIYNDYNELEGNDSKTEANYLLSGAADGKFSPNYGSRVLLRIQPGQFGTPQPVAHTDGNYVEASLGQLNLGEFYDGDDNDWYAFTLSAGAHVRVDQKWDFHGGAGPSQTDLILRLYDSDGVTALAQSQTAGEEFIDYDFRDPGTYYVRVNRFVGPGQDYKLFLTCSAVNYYPETKLAQTWNDSAGNETTTKAKQKVAGDATSDNNDTYNLSDNIHLPVGAVLQRSGPIVSTIWGNINRNGGDTVDWYHFYYSSAITARVQANFKHTQGDIDIYLYDQNLNLLGYSSSVDDDETIWRSLPAPGGTKRVYVKVQAVNGGGTNYTLSVGYPPGSPTNLAATDVSTNGKIQVTWSAPVGGNAANGYDLYYSDSEFGIYTRLAQGLTTTVYDLDLTATSKIPLQNSKYWFKVKATLTGQQDSDFSNADSGYVNATKPPVGQSASVDLYLDKVAVSFYSAPYDPALGTGNFGVPPVIYNVFAQPAGLNEELVASFLPDSGIETLIPALGGLPARSGRKFMFDFTGAPFWTQAQLRGVNVTFRIIAEGTDRPAAEANIVGRISGLAAPTTFTATRDLFTDKVRLSWTQSDPPSGIYPDGYLIQYQGQFDTGWTNLTTQIIPWADGSTNYDHMDGGSTGASPARRYRIRATRTGITSSPWVGWNGSDATRPHIYGWASGKGMLAPSFSQSNVQNDDVTFSISAYPQDSYFPKYYKCAFNVQVYEDFIGIPVFQYNAVVAEEDWHEMSLTNTAGYETRVNGAGGDNGDYIDNGTYYVMFAYTQPDISFAPSGNAPPKTIIPTTSNPDTAEWHFVTKAIN